MIAEIIPQVYDFDGRRIFHPSKKRFPSFKGRPVGSFFSQPLNVVCGDINEIRSFLSTCRYVSDQEQFGVRDHWMPPQEFERTRRGDCEDFALWTWRQLLALGYEARFVVGRAGKYGEGHAWVSLHIQDHSYVVEPLLARYRTFPRLTTLRYLPAVSVEVSDSHVKFFEHQKRAPEPTLRIVAPLVVEWLAFQLRMLPRLLLLPFYIARRIYRRKMAKRAATRASDSAR
jgi:hypothetical protein